MATQAVGRVQVLEEHGIRRTKACAHNILRVAQALDLGLRARHRGSLKDHVCRDGEVPASERCTNTLPRRACIALLALGMIETQDSRD